ncbi:prolipoprotein diacylglyceryl transferase [Lacinutrix sp. C3R15]|uniref:prolipoprotein diacylglyceryl transferase n=1 Tax=Flavobacteriaceae TaxID=49546 RepID=UPI001C0882F5|nr:MULTISPECIES: prolipoprotein diacylglyceryl transferase [Flavobacteriaceae]MBU2938774.1 prolipoprotein diacylglyceryl transferase [Lacinutrix sp. C3R15]MDO6622087.1 prolipoprotein diacylglyceryl transferase [Oceanihabitans sp. 1_MG-2023]
MYPELFKFQLSNFLESLFGVKQITVYSYAALIALGTLIAALYTKWRAKKELGITNLSNTFFYSIFIAGFIGGKLFYYLQDPMLYIQNPSLMYNNFSGGFVFYGSFVVIIPYVIWYLKKYQISVLPMLDILAITTTIVHAIGRFGCFCAGCCFGAPTDRSIGLVFPTTHGVSVHPTQLYEVALLLVIMLLLLIFKKRKQFNGQVFLVYLILYAFGRGVLELFRGDDRGFVVENIVSHSQFIGLCLITISSYFYYKFYKQININILNT